MASAAKPTSADQSARPELPFLTRDFEGVGGAIKQRPEDFFVQEIPLYEPGGHGEHVFAEIQKIGLTTFQALARLSQTLNVPERNIGYAGQKDAQAVTRQVFSIPGTTEQNVMAIQFPDLAVRWAVRHGNKLRLGHLAGNRFAIKIRNVEPTAVIRLRTVLADIEKRGMPNYFGDQRFGRRNDNDLLGAALVRHDNVGLLRQLLGAPDPAIDDPQSLAARRAFEARDNQRAMHHFPRHSGLERRVLARLMKTSRPSSAVHAIDDKLRRLWVSALQSRLFNSVVAARIDSLDRLMAGDLAYKHENGACFLVESAETEQPRCDAFEISPTGPLLGYRMTFPQHEPLAVEESVFAAAGLKPKDFRSSHLRVKGGRRPLRVRPTETELAAGVDEHGPHITVAFTLPPGAYATILMRELMKYETPNESAAESANSEEDLNEAGSEDGGDVPHDS